MIDERGDWEAMRQRARVHVEARHDWALNVRRYQDVYHLLLNPNSKARLSLAA